MNEHDEVLAERYEDRLRAVRTWAGETPRPTSGWRTFWATIVGGIFGLAVGWLSAFIVKGLDLITSGDFEVPGGTVSIVVVLGCIIGLIFGAFSASSRSGFAHERQAAWEADRDRTVSLALEALPLAHPEEFAAYQRLRAARGAEALARVEGSTRK